MDRFTAVAIGKSRTNVGLEVGLVRVVRGRVVSRLDRLVTTPGEVGEGATGGWSDVFAFLSHEDAGVWVGHEVPSWAGLFLEAASEAERDWPTARTFDTAMVSRRLLTLPSYSLQWVSDGLGISAPGLSGAPADAALSTGVLLAALRLSNSSTLDELSATLNIPMLELAADDDEIDPDEVVDAAGAARGFAGESVAFTGALTTLTRDDAKGLVDRAGGIGQANVTRSTTVLVTGDFTSNTFAPGAKYSGKLQKALDLINAGQSLEVLTEDQFIDRIRLAQTGLEALEARRRSVRSKAPTYVVDQARVLDPLLPYTKWLRLALASPVGRAAGGEPCIWCGASIRPRAFWLFRDRRVCAAACNERLKRSAKRRWDREGIQRPVYEGDVSY
jgi:DNA polymerase-3 subunit epsilon